MTIKRFGFAQFRFIIVAILFLAADLKAYQLSTAPLPPVVQSSMFTHLLELLNGRYFLMAVVVGEILFALVLIADIWRTWMWLLSLLGFLAFTLVSVMKGLSGESSCGCFGSVPVNPWITATFDATVVVLLAVFREQLDWSFPTLDRKKVTTVLAVWLVLAIPALFAMLSLKQQPYGTLGTEFQGFDGRKMISLEPEKWHGKEFPLISYFTAPHEGDVLKQGVWKVLLVHIDCERCLEMLADLKKQNAERVAVVIIPSRSSEQVPQMSFPTFVLNSQIDWFAETPRILELSRGICFSVGE